ncbi:hypothetical protein OK015_18640 [Mycobacterium sp. Aquia_216]|uniref:hypothetical protein n=1 Tax=Mycobacterium sp. Aquia_216 TaxID=2991729 RepID=UPI00227CD8A5|nr:hypothetical protein [Mycobacterium sp. Aquia_216]WAJ43226.1 hypothetical protein OK015_18640 [Mycobacterium sp. Aquia_216]
MNISFSSAASGVTALRIPPLSAARPTPLFDVPITASYQATADGSMRLRGEREASFALGSEREVSFTFG